jgi:hypothetical protein
MRILLDACVPSGLRGSFPRHDVSTAHELGWGDLDNGDLLDAMAARDRGRAARFAVRRSGAAIVVNALGFAIVVSVPPSGAWYSGEWVLRTMMAAVLASVFIAVRPPWSPTRLTAAGSCARADHSMT